MSDQQQHQSAEWEDRGAGAPPVQGTAADQRSASPPPPPPGPAAPPPPPPGPADPPSGPAALSHGEQHHGPPTCQQHPPYPGQGQVVAPKSPAVAALASFFLPGLGSMLNGHMVKGVVFVVVYLFSWLGFWLLIAVFFIGVIFLPPLLIVWIWGIVDAYQGAQRWNARHGIIS